MWTYAWFILIQLADTNKELAGVKAIQQEIRDQLQKETDKNIELGAEMLTLLNQKQVLQVHTSNAEGWRLKVFFSILSLSASCFMWSGALDS